MFGSIHGGFTFDHVLFHRGDVRVIDFDDCAWDYYSHDIATLRGRMEWRDDYADLRTALILGYPEERTFPPEHEALLAHSLKRNRRPSQLENLAHAVR